MLSKRLILSEKLFQYESYFYFLYVCSKLQPESCYLMNQRENNYLSNIALPLHYFGFFSISGDWVYIKTPLSGTMITIHQLLIAVITNC